MAKKEIPEEKSVKPKDKSKVSSPVQKLISKLNLMDFWTDSEVKNIDGQAEAKKKNEISKSFNDLMTQFKDKYTTKNVNENSETSEGYLELINSILLNNKNKSKVLTPEDLVKELNSTKSNFLSPELLERNEKIKYIKEIITSIPPVSEAINIYADSIISPDSFELSSFNFKNLEEEISKEMKEVLNEIKNKYELENDIRKFVKEAITFGCCYVAVVDYKQYFGRNLEEKEAKDKYITESSSTNKRTSLLESFIETSIPDKKIDFSLKYAANSILKENLNVSLDELNILLEDNVSLFHSFKDYVSSDVNSLKLVKQADDKKKEESEEEKEGNKKGSKDKTNKKYHNKVTGGFYKKLDIEKVVPLTVGELVVGYLYMEGEEKAQKNQLSNSNPQVSQGTATDLLTKNLANAIIKNLNLEFVEKNPKLNKLIHTILEENRTKNMKVKVIYLGLDDVFVFKNGTGVHGESILDNVLFTAKIYNALFLRTVMLKITRSKDRRMISVDVDPNDTKIEETIQSFIRDFRSRETTLMQELTLSNSIQTLGVFEDYFVPKVNGEIGFEITTMDGAEAPLTDEFLEWLLKQTLDGIGVPLEMLGFNTVEFSRTLAMINGKFLKAVVSKQVQFEKPLTNFFRKMVEITNTDINDINSLIVTLNRPLALTQQNLVEQISNKTEIAQFLTNNVLGENETDAVLKDKVTKKIMRDLTPSIQWDKYDEFVREAKLEMKKEKLEKNEDKESNTEEGIDDNMGDDQM